MTVAANDVLREQLLRAVQRSPGVMRSSLYRIGRIYGSGTVQDRDGEVVDALDALVRGGVVRQRAVPGGAGQSRVATEVAYFAVDARLNDDEPDDESEEVDMTNTERALAYLRSHGPARPEEIAEALGIHRSTVSGALRGRDDVRIEYVDPANPRKGGVWMLVETTPRPRGCDDGCASRRGYSTCDCGAEAERAEDLAGKLVGILADHVDGAVDGGAVDTLRRLTAERDAAVAKVEEMREHARREVQRIGDVLDRVAEAVGLAGAVGGDRIVDEVRHVVERSHRLRDELASTRAKLTTISGAYDVLATEPCKSSATLAEIAKLVEVTLPGEADQLLEAVRVLRSAAERGWAAQDVNPYANGWRRALCEIASIAGWQNVDPATTNPMAAEVVAAVQRMREEIVAEQQRIHDLEESHWEAVCMAVDPVWIEWGYHHLYVQGSTVLGDITTNTGGDVEWTVPDVGDGRAKDIERGRRIVEAVVAAGRQS